MAYMQKVFGFVRDDESFETLRPWWEVVLSFSIDIMVLASVTSVTSDLFQGAGSLICIPSNKTEGSAWDKQQFVEQECTELWPLYAKYFPYFLVLQCIPFMAISKAWKRICGDQLKLFNKLAEECRASPITKLRVDNFLRFQSRRMANAGRKDVWPKGDSNHNDDKTDNSVPATDGTDNSNADAQMDDMEGATAEEFVCLQLDADDARNAISLYDRIRELEATLDLYSSSCATYFRKCVVSVAFGAIVVGWGAKQIAIRDFDFYFPCSLDRLHHAHILDIFDYTCVNKTTTMSAMLQYLFLVVVSVHILMQIWGFLHCLAASAPKRPVAAPRSADIPLLPTKAERAAMEEGAAEDQFDACETLVSPDDVPASYPWWRQLGHVVVMDKNGANDSRFLQQLLRNSDKDAMLKFEAFGERRYRDRLEDVATCIQWPYAKLKEEMNKAAAEDQTNFEHTLSLADVNLLTLPRGLVKLPAANCILVELDVSFNENLVDLDRGVLEWLAKGLTTFKCRQSGLIDVGPIAETLVNLTYLDVSFNKIETLPRSMENLQRLRSLTLLSNPLRRRETKAALRASVLPLPHLKELVVEARFLEEEEEEDLKFIASELAPNLFNRRKL